MNKIVINGSGKLNGTLSVNGAKNSALPILAATLIAEGEYSIDNIPDLKDIRTMIKLLETFGLKAEKTDDHSYKITNSGVKDIEAPYELVKEMRASFVVMGSLLAHVKKARVSLPGGCAIGTRPIDFHLQGFEKLGAKIVLDHGFVTAEAVELVGARVKLPFPSVGATQNILMAAVKAKGETTILNAAREPEIDDLSSFLNKMGANISGIGTDELKIQGVEKLIPCKHSIIPDRIEAGTFIIASIINDGDLEIQGVIKEHLKGFIKKLEKMGVEFEFNNDRLKIKADLEKLKPVKISTEPYPGFPTDLQAQTMVLLSLTNGKSELKETIFENRFMHVLELNRMGAKIKLEGNKASINGPVDFIGAEVSATDLRAGAALVLAGLVADNTTIVNEIQHIERGYEDLVERLQSVGAKISKQ
ncbi:MAG: UDP-N-acetylglucosamine 1-carboxyvinyltransferase [Candidatus Magasanikbacteria bacterium]|jgi:UDP-N-acetylglucosamine 1-carboxyvinyltransferase|nr:UDP-N-acetylglucosamine 1-carboxyvinyltransferase [Candidatus Magasanikbacteria bacterium]MBT4314937.1 UDP-N-acetylglucosamine 1-carboxyvinyltransferase [Candidatus Magasanikbacteria bacterium]MBT4546893.1 UDP-N-acetylglucosamine 1-carboxyvinyltransferase [Candidatus Magasanikbacteria bacterium]MBT6819193.1 UDP-N-acetylglucosamine 1-carboxyvinyltransferase [Candidatus Magasanikbacteria bacterium]